MAQIALGVTGSVAAIRTPALTTALRQAGHDVRVVATEPALYFFDAGALPAADQDAGTPLDRSPLFRDENEWPRREAGRSTYSLRDPVLHIELRRWAELLIIAPLDANTLAKLAYGLSDNLLTCLYRAWDRDRPIVLAPAMNTLMWENPLTARHLWLLLEIHVEGAPAPPAGTTPERLVERINEECPHLRICPPQSKRLACGDEGMGAMAEVSDISATAELLLQNR